MIVLSIDPGSVTSGYALLEKRDGKINYLNSGIMQFNASLDFLHRAKEIYHSTIKIIDEFKPDEIALESLIYVKSPTALIKLAQSRGIMLAALSQKYHQKIFEYSPNQVKSSVTGHGHSDKTAIQKMLWHQLGITDFKTHDESDAIAIGLCHLFLRQNMSANIKSSSRKGLASSLAHKIKEQNL